MRWYPKPKWTKRYRFVFYPVICESCRVRIWMENIYERREWYAYPGAWHYENYCPECGIRIYGEVDTK